MTAHGAKGLQAPLVILPDTTGAGRNDDGLAWVDDPSTGLSLPVWCPSQTMRCRALENLRNDAAGLRAEEENRLLYVALTRAEDWLLICGWKSKNAPPAQSWYRQVERGFDHLGVASQPFDDGRDGFPATIRVWETLQSAPTKAPKLSEVATHAVLPDWAGQAPLWQPMPPPIEPALPQPLAPSRPEGASLGRVPEADSPLLARDAGGMRFRRGQVVHSLLQHLPELPEAEWEAAALHHIARSLPDLAAPQSLAAEVLAVLRHPGLGVLFGPNSRAEVPLSGTIGHQVIGGLIDRLAITPGRVWVADYKTNRNPPATVAHTPSLYLRQMAAYRALLMEIFPESEICCVLIWTIGARADQLPPSLLDGYAPGAAIDA
jgi:ATP-dependent helicase/nuclease subunit A